MGLALLAHPLHLRANVRRDLPRSRFCPCSGLAPAPAVFNRGELADRPLHSRLQSRPAHWALLLHHPGIRIKTHLASTVRPPVMMRLYMTRRSSLHTVYSDPEGHTLYKVRTPFTLAKGRRWDISRAKEHPSPYPAQREYDPLAQIHWRRDLTTLSIGEQSINAANFFRRTGLYGRYASPPP